MPGEPPGSAARAGAFGAALERWAPWAAGIVLVAGVATYAGTRLASGSSAPAPAGSVRLDPKAARVAREFVATAVARRHLARAWELAAPDLKQGMTLAEWNTGTIPVTPYRGDVRAARYEVQTSHPDDAVLEVTFLSPPGGTFLMTLERLDGKWLVFAWTPRSIVGANG